MLTFFSKSIFINRRPESEDVYSIGKDFPKIAEVPMPPISNLSKLVAGIDMVPIQIGSYTELPKWIRYDASDNQLGATGLNSAPFQFDASLAQNAPDLIGGNIWAISRPFQRP